jgi:hypothetical protein
VLAPFAPKGASRESKRGQLEVDKIAMTKIDDVCRDEASFFLYLMRGAEESDVPAMKLPKEIRTFTFPQIRYWAIAWSLGLGGLSALVAAQFLIAWEPIRFIVSEIGVASLIAGLLAGIVEPYFRGEFARDAFLAAFRYVLPSEFKDEVEKIIRFEFISEKQVWTVKIDKVSDSVVLVTTTYERTVRNKTKSNKPVDAWYEVEDYQFPDGATQILDCGVYDDTEAVQSFQLRIREHYVEAKTAPIMVGPDGIAKVSGKALQYRRTNDSVVETFRTPIINPEIEVLIDDNEFHHIITFGTHGDYTTSKYKNHYTLSGVYFPGQFMHVRWWPKKGHHELIETVAVPAPSLSAVSGPPQAPHQ